MDVLIKILLQQVLGNIYICKYYLLLYELPIQNMTKKKRKDNTLLHLFRYLSLTVLVRVKFSSQMRSMCKVYKFFQYSTNQMSGNSATVQVWLTNCILFLYTLFNEFYKLTTRHEISGT